MLARRALILLGIIIALSPFLGLPLSVLAWVLPALGALVTGMAAFLPRRSRAARPVEPALPYEPTQAL